ncbi:MAG: class I SAM-dependent methyltransferase [Pseudonocardiaceae bacterium]
MSNLVRRLATSYQAYPRRVPGWLGVGDAAVITLLSKLQHDLGYIGSILEIGVYHGKSAILLGGLLSSQETLEVCDVFDLENLSRENFFENRRFYKGLRQSQFEQNYLHFFSELPVIHSCPSSELSSRLAGRKFRLIHIDGSHLHENVIGDISTAMQSLAIGGLIVFDDWAHSDHPGVAAAIWETVRDLELIPVLATDMKMYAIIRSNGGVGDDMTEGIHRIFRAHQAFDSFEHIIRGKKLLQVRLKGKTRRNSICF